MIDREPAEAGDITDAVHSPALAAATAVSLASAALAACGGGQDRSDRGPGPATPYVEERSPARAARFLAQAALGANQAQVDEVLRNGYAEWLDAQLALPLSTPSTFDWMVARGWAAGVHLGSDSGVDNALWRRLMSSPDVLRQRVVFAMSQIFVVSINGMGVWWGQFGPAAFWDLLEAHAFGSFRELIERIALSPAMGVYLNMRGSQKTDGYRQPDENFARELLQLFTIGLVELNTDGSPKLRNNQPIESYGNADIRELAKVFTGWDLDRASEASPEHMRRPMVLDEAKHEEGAKQFLGITIPAGIDGRRALTLALDGIVAHPNVGPFLGRQLIQHLVTSNPSPAYVARVATVFNNNGQGKRGDLKAVISAVLLDREARPDLSASTPLATTHGKLREPVLRLVQWARLFGVSSRSDGWSIPNLATRDSLNQSPLRAPSVFNFYRPGYVPPQSLIADQNMLAPEFQITDEASVISYANFMQRVIANGNGDVVPDYAGWLTLPTTDLLARLNLLLTGGVLPERTLSLIAEAVDSSELSGPGWLDALPFNQWADEARRRMVTAIFLVMCSPDYLVQR